MKTLNIHHQSTDHSYPILIQHGLLDSIAEEVQKVFSGKKIAIITDKNVDYYYGDKVVGLLEASGYQLLKLVVPPGESSKSLSSLEQIYDELAAFQLTRSDLIIALGGGVVGDLAGFAAASFLRGVPYIQVPTTLLAQVDSSVGGKVAVDLTGGKNLVGSFYHPQLVLMDPQVLTTLDNRAFNAGMAEVIKYGCIRDRAFFDQINQANSRSKIMTIIEEVLVTCCQIKQEVVEEDERDHSIRMVLNFGHTIGHAIEAYYDYNKYMHGEAISIGMVYINQLAEEQGLTSVGSTDQLRLLLEAFDLPTKLEVSDDLSYIIPFIKKDKKNVANHLTVVLLDDIGTSYLKSTTIKFFNGLL